MKIILCALVAFATTVISVPTKVSEEDHLPSYNKYHKDIWQQWLAEPLLQWSGDVPHPSSRQDCEDRTFAYSYVACNSRCAHLKALQSEVCDYTPLPPILFNHEMIVEVCCPHMAWRSKLSPEQAEKVDTAWLTSILERPVQKAD